MKYTITINQSAVFSNGMINKTDLVDWAIIDYLKDFAIYRKSKRIYVDDSPRPSPSTIQPSKSTRSKNLQTISRGNITQEGRGNEYIWLNYNHLIASLPLLKFKGTWTVSRRINKLRQLGLIKTYKAKDNTLYYTFTDKLIDICFAKQSDIERLRKANATCLCEGVKRPKQSPTNTNVKIGDCHADARNDRNATPPITSIATDPIAPSATAQYKTKNTIYDKVNNKDNSFSSSSLKPKTKYSHGDTETTEKKDKELFMGYKQRTLKNTPCAPCLSGKKVKGFTTMSGSVWNVLENIRQRQQNTTLAMRCEAQTRNKENTKAKLFCHPERSEGSQSEILRENPQNDKFFVGSSNACVPAIAGARQRG